MQLAKTRPGADCDSDHQLLIAKFRFKLKKAKKTTRPFRHNLNQISYDYTMEVTNRFKGLYLVDRVPEELRTEGCNIVHEAVTIINLYLKPKQTNKQTKRRCLEITD